MTPEGQDKDEPNFLIEPVKSEVGGLAGRKQEEAREDNWQEAVGGGFLQRDFLLSFASSVLVGVGYARKGSESNKAELYMV